MFRPSQQLQASRIVGRISIGIIRAELESVRYRERCEDLGSIRRGPADIFQRRESRIRVDQVLDLVVKVSHAEANSILQDRLFEPEVVTLTFLWAQIWIRETIESRKADEQLGQARRLKSGAVPRL